MVSCTVVRFLYCWVSGLPINGTPKKKEAVQRNTRVSTKVQVLTKDTHRVLKEESDLHATG